MKDNYLCHYWAENFEIDGKLDKEIWQTVPWSPRFVDVIGNVPAIYDTRSAAAWNEDYLYIAFYCESPYPKASMTKRDDLLWFDNDIEVFIDGGDTYYELQVNNYNTVYEAFYVWRDAYKENKIYRQQPEFDVIENDARVFGGNHDRKGRDFWNGSHERGNRWAFLNWDFPGLETAVHVDGKLNDDSVVSNAVTFEIKLPWSGMKWLAVDREYPPSEGDIWKIFFARYDNLRINGKTEAVGWSWDYIGSDDNHRPELFTPITFTKKPAK